MRERDMQALRASYETLNTGDIEATLAVLAPDAEWHESSALPTPARFAAATPCASSSRSSCSRGRTTATPDAHPVRSY